MKNSIQQPNYIQLTQTNTKVQHNNEYRSEQVNIQIGTLLKEAGISSQQVQSLRYRLTIQDVRQQIELQKTSWLTALKNSKR